MINPTETNEKHYDYGEEKICKEFGCGRKLTLRESLFGDRCIKHSKYEKLSSIINFYDHPLQAAVNADAIQESYC